MPQWYKNVAYLIASKEGDEDWMTASTATLESDRDELVGAPPEMEMMLRHQLMNYDRIYSPEVQEVLAFLDDDSIISDTDDGQMNSLADKTVRRTRRPHRGRSISSTTRTTPARSVVIRDHRQLTQSHRPFRK